jgi:hypothetical protein
MRVFKISLLTMALGVLAVPMISACSSDANKGGEAREEVGSLDLDLVGVSTMGATYRLHNGSFSVTGPKAVTLSTETDPDASSIRQELPAGNYLIKLKAGYTLEKEVMGTFTTVKSVLVSDNPAGFQIFDQGVTGVVFRFKAGDDVVQLGNGRLDVSIAIDDGSCPMGTATCNGVCTDIFNDPNNCGACGNACMAPASCQGGSCQVACPPGTFDCNGSCVDIFSDPNNCGGCFIQCGPGDSCGMGICQSFCPPGAADCDGDGICSDLQSDPNNCGGCGTVCAAGFSCQNGFCQNPGPLFEFSGIATDLPVASLSGWTQCYTDTYADFRPMSDILAACSGNRLLLACRPTGSPVLQLAANAERPDVLFDCGTQADCVHAANGVGWYFSDQYSWGFAPENAPVNRNSCDFGGADGDRRLCWHTGSSAINTGYRCGETTLNGDASYERLIFQAN